jgi:hypothetical protein
MAFKIADLFVSITGNTQGIDKTLDGLKGRLLALSGIGGSTAARLLAPLTAMGGAAGLAATGVVAVAAGVAATVYGLSKAANLASDLNETVSKTDQVFGANSANVKAAAKEMAAAWGIPRKEFLDSASMFGLIAQGAGVAENEAAEMSVTLAKLAADASSFYNVPIDVALEKMRAGLVGEAEPLRAFGVMLSEDAVKAKALAMGFKEQGGQIANNAKIAARYALIQEGLAKAQGDLDRTGGGYANQVREMQGRLTELGTTIGEAVLPAFTELVRNVNSALKSLQDYLDAAKFGRGMLATALGWDVGPGDPGKFAREQLEALEISKRNERQRQQALADQGVKKEKEKARTFGLEEWVKELQGFGFGKDALPKQQLAVAEKQLNQLQKIAAAGVRFNNVPVPGLAAH